MASNRPDPFGYYARKAQREAAIRAAAPYRIDAQAEIVPTFEALESRLNSVGLGVDLDGIGGRFRIFDLFTAAPCGTVWSIAP